MSNNPYKNNFFIAAVGRSGTTWLANLLNRSSSHTVAHEEADDRDPRYAYNYSPFPIERFTRPNYGECHGFLRYHLSEGITGPEIQIPTRVVLLRDPQAVIKSWMNRDGRQIDELSATCYELMREMDKLIRWAKATPGTRIILFEDLTTDLTKLQSFLDWLNVDVTATKADLSNRVNANRDEWFDWDQVSTRTFIKVAERLRFER